MQLSRRATASIVAAGGLLGSTLLAPAARAAEAQTDPPLPPVEVSPTSGASGDTFSLSGTGCVDTFGLGHRVDLVLWQERDGLPAEFGLQLDFTSPAPVADDGSWVGQAEVPHDDPARFWDIDPDVGYEVQVFCLVRHEDGLEHERPYPRVPFDVLPTPPPTPPTTARPTTAPPTTAPPPGPAPAPPPATPIVDDPDLTG